MEIQIAAEKSRADSILFIQDLVYFYILKILYPATP